MIVKYDEYAYCSLRLITKLLTKVSVGEETCTRRLVSAKIKDE